MMTRFWSTVLVLTVACLIGLNASAAEKKNGEAKKPKKTPEEIFQMLDKNNDGKVTLDEFKANKKTPEQLEKAEKAFKKRDADSDGVLTLEEFTAAPKKGGKENKK